jgi:hypothetical protein
MVFLLQLLLFHYIGLAALLYVASAAEYVAT